MSKIIYIADGITGITDYRHKFAMAESKLGMKGYITLNPAVLPEGMPYESYFPICYAMMDAANAAYFLKGWEQSKGARMEFEYATAKGMGIMFEEKK